ncbi:MAG: uroporphyrinogen decarboxylase [Ignavibacteriales bacterium]|nr:uroporphyrinogen decarboxylase [Ignavibacteriales bacterium]
MRNFPFLRACRREPVNRTPVWMMRQAGRYLPEYRAIRARNDFLTMCKTPELASEVSLQPVEILGVDACIIFSDILVLPEAMGMNLVVEEGTGGPRFTDPIRSRADIDRLGIPDPSTELKFVLDAVRLTRQRLDGTVPLIGFSGSPWTLASYMVEGSGSKTFRTIKEMVYAHPQDLHHLLEKLAQAGARYLNAVIEAGAQAIQIFDSWGGILPPDEFREFSLRSIAHMMSLVRKEGTPVIVFCRECGHSLEQIADTGTDVVGIDWTIDLRSAKDRIGSHTALQGNLDPAILYSSPDVIRSHVIRILEKFGPAPGHVFNLGHGILPDTPVEHAKAFVQAVKEESPRFHRVQAT